MAKDILKYTAGLANDFKSAQISYGLRGQLNIELPRKSNESRKEHKTKLQDLVAILEVLTEINPETVRVSDTRVIIENPTEKLRKMVDGFEIVPADIRFDTKEPKNFARSCGDGIAQQLRRGNTPADTYTEQVEATAPTSSPSR